MADTVWFITGSSRGLGRAIALAALERGDRVAATARTVSALEDLAATYPGHLIVLPLDVTDPAQVQDAVARAHEHFGRLDVVVNNAGYANLAAVEDTSGEDFRAQVETDFFGVVTTTKAVLPILREQGSGRIINVSSVGARVGTPGLAAYQAAKWAVSGFTEVLAAEVAPLGIHVTAIEPGGMPTDWAGSSMRVPAPSPAYQNTVGAMTAFFTSGQLKPLSDTGKVARAVLRVADADQPPTRLLLGSDALAGARAAATALAASDATWEQLSRSTDRDEATDAERDPLGQQASRPETVVRRFIDEVVNGGNLDLLPELWTDDLAWHGGSMGDIHGLPAYRDYMADNTSGAFTGMHLDIKEIIATGSKCVVRFTNSGTQTGTFMGAPGTGEHAEWLGIGIYTVTNGKISEAWFGEDILGMLIQLGAVTLPQ